MVGAEDDKLAWKGHARLKRALEGCDLGGEFLEAAERADGFGFGVDGSLDVGGGILDRISVPCLVGWNVALWLGVVAMCIPRDSALRAPSRATLLGAKVVWIVYSGVMLLMARSAGLLLS